MIGIIPAGGLGSRLAPLRYAKELLPIVYRARGPGESTALDAGEVHPRPVIALSLDQMERAGVTECAIVISEAKLELVRVLGEHVGAVRLAYVVRAVARGLADAIDAPAVWIAERAACLALPDTVIEPPDALAQVRDELEQRGADLVLGVFPTAHPEELGPVLVDADGTVVSVLDKPAATDLRNTWGLAAWSPRFGALLHAAVVADPGVVLGAVFQRAVDAGLRVRAVTFATGRFLDVGTPAGLAAALQR